MSVESSIELADGSKYIGDIVNELPEIKGFSDRKMKRMLRFYREYAFPSSVDPSPGEHATLPATVKVPQPVALLGTHPKSVN